MDRRAVRDPGARGGQAAGLRLAPEQTDAVVEAIAAALGDAELTALTVGAVTAGWQA